MLFLGMTFEQNPKKILEIGHINTKLLFLEYLFAKTGKSHTWKYHIQDMDIKMEYDFEKRGGLSYLVLFNIDFLLNKSHICSILYSIK